MDNFQENSTLPKINFQFKKKEKLCSKKIIDKVFANGKSFLSFPIKVVYIKTELPKNVPIQAAFTASKKGFKKAVDRNQIKRKMRESYRLNKAFLYAGLSDDQWAVFFIFIGKEIPDFQSIDAAMKKAINKFHKEAIPKTE